MNAEAGVPVGDTTLLAKLREARDRRGTEDSYVYRYDLVGATLDALPAVVTLIEAAQRLRDVEGIEETEAARQSLFAALAPFVGEATQ